MATWDELRTSAPELAELALERFRSTDLVMLGTLKRDGWPRVTPIEWTVWDGEFLIGGMWKSKKMLDLLRDPRCVVHSTTTDKNGTEGDVKLYARAAPLAREREAPYWDHIFETIGFRPAGPAHVFTLEFSSAGYVRFGDGQMRMLTWPNGGWSTRKT